jgi:hypothetical protein
MYDYYRHPLEEVFGTKTALICGLEAMRDSYEPGDRVSEQDEVDLQMIWGDNALEEELGGRTISHYEVRTHKQEPRVFFVVFTDGSSAAFNFMRRVDDLYARS